MMMQSRRREHGSSGELDVFGATSYFAGLPPAHDDDRRRRRPSSATEPSSADRLYFQAKVVQRDTTEDNSFRGPHQQQLADGLRDHEERHVTNKQLQLQVVAAKRLPSSGKSKLAALLSFMVSPSPSPSPRASFRKENKKQEAPSTTTRLLRQAEAASAAGGEKETAANNSYKANSSPSSSSRESSSMQLQGLFGAHDDGDDDELDLGVATGDRRLQGITVVRGGGGVGEERWVVRCVPVAGGAWDDEEHHREKMLDAETESASSEQNINKDEMAEVEQGHDDDGNVDPAHSQSWDSDSSSDLFDLDLEYR